MTALSYKNMSCTYLLIPSNRLSYSLINYSGLVDMCNTYFCQAAHLMQCATYFHMSIIQTRFYVLSSDRGYEPAGSELGTQFGTVGEL